MSDSSRIAKTQGEWIAVSYHPYSGVTLKCSSCHNKVRHVHPTKPFCPNCGAEMTNAGEIPRGWGQALDSF